MFGYSEDKNMLAMMAIPVVLSLFFGFSSSVNASNQNELAALEQTYVDGAASESSPRPFSEKNSKKLAMQLAIENSDYEAFKIATEGTPFSDVMTAEAFSLLVNEYQLQKKGYRPSTFDFE